MSHSWVATFANYSFQLYYKTGKTNANVDALPCQGCPSPCACPVSWASSTESLVQAMQEAICEGLTSPIEAYSCNLCVVDSVEDGPQVTCMTTEDLQQAQLADPILGQVITRM